MAQEAYCMECGRYVRLDSVGLCPQGHGRPSLRGVREATAASAPKRDTPARPSRKPAAVRLPAMPAVAAPPQLPALVSAVRSSGKDERSATVVAALGGLVTGIGVLVVLRGSGLGSTQVAMAAGLVAAVSYASTYLLARWLLPRARKGQAPS